MSHAPTRPRVTTLHIDALRKRRETAADIASGRLPTLEEIYSGLGFARGDWKADCRLWCTDILLDEDLSEYHDRFEHLRDSCSRTALEACRTAVEHDDDDGRLSERLDVYLTADNHPDAWSRVIRAILSPTFARPDFRRIIYGLAVARSHSALISPQTSWSVAERLIQGTAADLGMSLEAARMIANQERAPSPEDALHQQMEELANAILEDRAEVETRPAPPPSQGIVVVPALPIPTGHKATVFKAWAEVAGRPIPTIQVGGVGEAIKKIADEMPHAGPLALQIAMTIQAGTTFRLPQPILLLGDPGEGKTTFARCFADGFGVPCETHYFAGAADSSMGGTSAQYASVRENAFLQLIGRERIANPVVILDEIEKASPSRHNGSALDVVLPLLERHTASRYRDPALEVEVDLSGISVIATANSLDGIPGPLKDRFKIYRMPKPTWEHVGALSRSILDKIAEERSLDRRWFPDLAADELEVIKRVWTGGSIRRLERAIRILVEGRDQFMGRA